MIPKIIIIDEKGPEEGMDIHEKYLLVREENYERVITALTELTGIEFLAFTREEYLEWIKVRHV